MPRDDICIFRTTVSIALFVRLSRSVRSCRHSINGASAQTAPHPSVPPNPPNQSWAPQSATSPPNGIPAGQLPGPHVPPKTPQQQSAQLAASTATGQPNRSLLPQQPPVRNSQTPLQPSMSIPQRPAPSSSNVPNPPNGTGLTPQQQHLRTSQFQQQLRQGMFPALPSPAFNSAFQHWSQEKRMQIDEKLLTVEGKKIDLHRLHQEVISTGTIGVCPRIIVG